MGGGEGGGGGGGVGQNPLDDMITGTGTLCACINLTQRLTFRRTCVEERGKEAVVTIEAPFKLSAPLPDKSDEVGINVQKH